jgi:hypothetical protein
MMGQAWEAVMARFDKPSASVKMALLDSLLNLRCAGMVVDYISSYNELLNRLKGMGEVFGKDLQVAILLRGLPSSYAHMVAMVKLREELPPVEGVISMIMMHDKHERRDEPDASQAYTVQCDHNGHEASRCWKLHPELVPTCYACGMRGHIKKRCPSVKNDPLVGQSPARNCYASYDMPLGCEGAVPPICL